MAEGSDCFESTEQNTDFEKWKADHLDRFLNDTITYINSPIQNDLSAFEEDLMSLDEFQKKTVKINNMIARRQGKLPSMKSENQSKHSSNEKKFKDPIRNTEVPVATSKFSRTSERNGIEVVNNASAITAGPSHSDIKNEITDKTNETLKQFSTAELPSYLTKIKNIEESTRSIRHTLKKFDRSNKYDNQLNAKIKAYMMTEDENERTRLYTEIIKGPVEGTDLSGSEDNITLIHTKPSTINKKDSDTIQIINMSTPVSCVSCTDIKSKNIVKGTSKQGSKSSRVNSTIKHK